MSPSPVDGAAGLVRYRTAAELAAALGDRPVAVYRNLHQVGRCYSVRDRATGRVVAYSDAVTLVAVRMRVQPAGRTRVRAEGRKNVHAYLAGTLATGAVDVAARRAFYDPYTVEGFTDHDDRTRVTAAAAAWLDETGLRYLPEPA